MGSEAAWPDGQKPASGDPLVTPLGARYAVDRRVTKSIQGATCFHEIDVGGAQLTSLNSRVVRRRSQNPGNRYGATEVLHKTSRRAAERSPPAARSIYRQFLAARLGAVTRAERKTIDGSVRAFQHTSALRSHAPLEVGSLRTLRDWRSSLTSSVSSQRLLVR